MNHSANLGIILAFWAQARGGLHRAVATMKGICVRRAGALNVHPSCEVVDLQQIRAKLYNYEIYPLVI